MVQLTCVFVGCAVSLYDMCTLSVPNNEQDVLVRAHSVVLECEEFMRAFEEGMWIAKALKRDKHRESFNELHESITYVFQVATLLQYLLAHEQRVSWCFVLSQQHSSYVIQVSGTWPERPNAVE